jgi:hypothetical protein
MQIETLQLMLETYIDGFKVGIFQLRSCQNSEITLERLQAKTGKS